MSGKQHIARFLLAVSVLSLLCTVSPQAAHAQQNQNTNITFDTRSPSGVINTLKPTNVANLVVAGAAEAKESAVDQVVTWVVAGATTVVGLLATLLSWIAAMILVLAGFFLDTAISISTYGLSEMVNGNLRNAIDETWKIFRDLVNIGFVFIMLYIAINLILQTESKQAKEGIKNVIIAALLVNFSFFFAALVVDVSNQLALSIMQSIEKQLGDQSVSSFLLDKTDALNLTELGGIIGNNSSVFSSDPDKMLQWGIGAVMSLITLLVLAVVLFIGAFMLIGRTLAVIFLLITSPIGFIGKAFPMTKKMANEWWDSLVGNAFALPVFLLFIFISFRLMGDENGGILAIVSSSNTTASVTTFSNMGSGGSTIADLVSKMAAPMVRYSIVIGLFLAALYAAKKMHSMGNQALAKLNGNITAAVGGAALSTAGFAGRQSVGRLANWAADKDGFKEIASKYRLGALALQATRGIGGASFDARNSRTFTGVASATGVGDKAFGAAGGKGGYRQGLKDAAGRETTFAAEAIGQASKKTVEADTTVSTAKTTSDTAKAAWLAAKTDPTKTKYEVEQAKQTFEVAEKAYQQAYTRRQNRDLTAYSNRLKNSVLFKPSRSQAGKNIEKEIAKALEDSKGKYDVLKALNVGKSDK